MKICRVCNQQKPTEEIIKNRCKSCRSKYHLEWHHRTKEQRKQKIKVYKKTSKDRLNKFILEYLLEHPCVDCGESDIVVLDFDHLKDKTTSIGRMLTNGKSIITMEEEIRKCEVRCANCHRRKTAKQFNWWRI
jgi:hypothetical protein